MSKERLAAFSDGVFAIIITIMVLEMKPPHQADWNALLALWPVFLSYILSFVYVAIYWNNHHHMLHTLEHVTGRVLWANMHLLFWVSLTPFATAWMGENHFARDPVALYGVILLMCALGYLILQSAIIQTQGPNSVLRTAIDRDWKGKFSIIAYIFAVFVVVIAPWLAGLLYVAVAIMWIVPDQRIERLFSADEKI